GRRPRWMETTRNKLTAWDQEEEEDEEEEEEEEEGAVCDLHCYMGEKPRQ
ncbi:hypothetical protein LSAT2_010176, partial [Lamellibrachia satsuma]